MVLTCPDLVWAVVLADSDGVVVADPNDVDATDPDGVGSGGCTGLWAGVDPIYRNMSQNRQLSLGNSAQIFIECKFYATSSLEYIDSNLPENMGN